jgi:lysozyme family protein
MANFKIANKLTRISEGGYSDVYEDNGNWTGGKIGNGILIGTKYGISAPVLMAYLGRVPKVDEMKNLSEDVASKIYIKNYWNVIRGDEIANQDIANKIYDMAVTSGNGTAIKLAKRARNYPESTKMDDEFLNHLNQVK